MSNKIYDESLFNEEHKLRFLKGMGEASFLSHSRILKRASILEKQLEKDLYDFNLFEVSNLMKLLAPTTAPSSRNQLQNIKKYIDWAISNDLRFDNINPLLATMTEPFIERFVDHSRKYLFTDKEIDSIVGRIVNFQDSALIQCLFEGIMGRAYSEILNILQTDINPESNILIVRNKPAFGSLVEREVSISDKLLRLLQSAARQTTYSDNNGTSTGRVPIKELISNSYIIRPVDMHTKHMDVADSSLVSRRIRVISKWFDYPYLSPNNIRKSGMLRYAKELMDKSGKFDRIEVSAVCQKFNIDVKGSARLVSEFLNIETIESLYS